MTDKQFIEVEEGEKVVLTHEESDSENWIFVCHGFGGNRERQSEYLELTEHGFNVVTVSFRGNGESDGEFIDQTLTSRIKDLKAVVEHFEPEKYALFGTSFGGNVVFHSSLELDPEAVVGKAPVTYSRIMDKFKSVVEEKGRFEYIDGKPIDDRFVDDFYSYSFSEVEEELDVSVLIFHGREDETVHTENSVEAAGNLRTDTTLSLFQGEKHSFSGEAKKDMRVQMVDWLRNNGF